MVADLLFRVACHGGGDEPLNIHLKRITDSAYTRKTLGGEEIEGESVAPVIAESHDAECRRDIMRYLHECLSEPNGKRWQRIYGALALTEKIMQWGSPALLSEVAQGQHFDVVQQVIFLENFDALARGCTDRRAQTVVRKKASELRTILVPWLEKAAAEDLLHSASLNSKDVDSTCSSGGISTATPSTAASSSRSSPSSVGSAAVPRSPSNDVHIDDAFDALREWMESGSSHSSSPRSSPGDSEFSIDDVDWEPLEDLPPAYFNAAAMQAKPSGDMHLADCMSDGSVDVDVFFTPMAAPAFAPPQIRTLLSL